MWNEGSQQKIIPVYEDFNEKLKELNGELDEMTAKLTLIQFLRRNLGYAFELMSGMELLKEQEIILKALFARDNALVVAGRGVGKSTIIAMYCCLYPIFFPNSKICLISANFRGARRIFEQAEKMVKGEYAYLLQECFPTEPRRLNDIIQWKMENGSEIFALPLSNGEGLRGTRASTVFVDEGLLISKDIQNNVIRPFLTAKQDYLEETKIRRREDELIKAGVISEADRISFPKNKYLICSSASYDSEYLYSVYKDYITSATSEKINVGGKEIERTKESPTYVVIQASYKALPESSFLDLTQINSAAANGGDETDYFKREYEAQFISEGDSYYSMKRMNECTVEANSQPTTQLRGEKGKEYILAIDPSYSASKASDFFAMGVYQIVLDERRIVLVHSYGRAGMSLNDHYHYMTYLLTHFNIVWITIDSSGTEFIDSYNESVIAQTNVPPIKLGYIKADLDCADEDYMEQLAQLKNEHNVTTRNIVYPQKFNGESIRRMNEYLQGGINAKRVWWASGLQVNEEAFKKALERPPHYEIRNKHGKTMPLEEMIYEQDAWIYETKRQLNLIEVKTTALGTMQFDLPAHIRKSTDVDKPRRDNYTCILMGYTASKHYFALRFTPIEEVQSTFTPFVI